MRVWEKSYLYTLLLFVLVFFICIFIIVLTSFSAMLDAERDAAMHEAHFIARAVDADISALEKRSADSNQAIYNVLSAYGDHYEKFGIYLWLQKQGSIIYSSRQAASTPTEYQNATVCSVITSGSNKYIRITNALQQTQSRYMLAYQKNIDAVYSAQNRRTVFLVLLGVALSVLLAVGLYYTLSRLYRPLNKLAHELKTPLTAIQGYAEYLQVAATDVKERYSASQYIIDESKRLTEITNKLLIMADLRDGSISKAKVDIEPLFENAVMTFKRVSYEIKQNYFYCDKALMQSLINNLVSNAVKATPNGQMISLKAYNNTIEVSDKGSGMSSAQLSHANNPSANSSGGSGLGIPLCHQIAKLHGAKLVFTSASGKGTTAKLIFTTR